MTFIYHCSKAAECPLRQPPTFPHTKQFQFQFQFKFYLYSAKTIKLSQGALQSPALLTVLYPIANPSCFFILMRLNGEGSGVVLAVHALLQYVLYVFFIFSMHGVCV